MSILTSFSYNLITLIDVMDNAQLQKTGNLLFEKSKDILAASQTESGATTASLPGTRYAGYSYPRDHAYATRAFLALEQYERAEQALTFILTCELAESAIMSQRYDLTGKNASYKPPQIDGNAQTLLSLTGFLAGTKESGHLSTYIPRIKQLVHGIISQKHTFAHGSLIHSVNGIIEYSPFESGYDLYTNAVCCRALFEISHYSSHIGNKLAAEAQTVAKALQRGIRYYLYYEKEQTFLPCLRTEPDSSYVILANLKSYLALSDFAIFPHENTLITTGLRYHLQATQNKALGGYNRYHELMGRHNFGNGPWPMVMLRLAQHYLVTQETQKAEDCLQWVISTAQNNLDMPNCLPEHVATKASFQDEYNLFKIINETSPRPAKEKEYQLINQSKTMKKLDLAYAVNPLVWSHAQFILTWKQLQTDKNAHNW